ncbi:MAG: hypothetical protein OXN17_17530 [Candidatus Poribacteria bacterium]|nr:hypothetical protein [Candidatus Poribacteria bacterium]MDE0503523.1 hypothetical protein [Candidatus Poribacteria bacterium]
MSAGDRTSEKWTGLPITFAKRFTGSVIDAGNEGAIGKPRLKGLRRLRAENPDPITALKQGALSALLILFIGALVATNLAEVDRLEAALSVPYSSGINQTNSEGDRNLPDTIEDLPFHPRMK